MTRRGGWNVRLRRRSSGHPVIYLVAPSGNPNFGDELIARGWLRWLAREHPQATVVLDCHTPGQAAVLLAGAHPRLIVTDTIWRINAATVGLPVDIAVEYSADAVRNPGRDPRLVDGVELLRSASVIHFLGGGYLNAVWPHHTGLLASALEAGSVSGGRVVATGQGLMPPPDGRCGEHLAALGARFDLFDVRDEPSMSVIGGDTVGFSADDAWLDLDPRVIYDAGSPITDRRFMFCLQSDLVEDAGGVDGIERVIVELIDRWQITGDDAAFVEGIPGNDRILYDRLSPRLPGAAFVPFTALWNHGVPAHPDQVWVSSRFHLHLVAAAAGASGVVVSGRADYYPVKHGSLMAAGSQWIGIDAVGDTPPSAGGFEPDVVATLAKTKRAVAEKIYH